MRGKIIQYNPHDGRGIVSAQGSQYSFGIQMWGSDEAPQVNMPVDLALEGNHVLSVLAVPSGAVARELFGSAAGEVSRRFQAQGPLWSQIEQLIGLRVLLAYAAFLIGTFVFSFITVRFFGTYSITLWDLADLNQQFKMGLSIRFVLVLCCLSVAIPFLWRHPLARLAFTMPSLLYLYMGVNLGLAYLNYRQQQEEAAKALGRFGMGGFAKLQESVITAFFKIVSPGFGFYLTFGAALFLLYVVLREYLFSGGRRIVFTPASSTRSFEPVAMKSSAPEPQVAIDVPIEVQAPSVPRPSPVQPHPELPRVNENRQLWLWIAGSVVTIAALSGTIYLLWPGLNVKDTPQPTPTASAPSPVVAPMAPPASAEAPIPSQQALPQDVKPSQADVAAMRKANDALDKLLK